MPWKARKSKGGGWDIVRADTGKVVGHSDTEAKAKASVRARYANTKEPLHKRFKRVHGVK